MLTRRLLTFVLCLVGVALVVGAFALARRLGVPPAVAAALVAWLSPVLAGGPGVLCAAAIHSERRSRAAVQAPAPLGDQPTTTPGAAAGAAADSELHAVAAAGGSATAPDAPCAARVASD